MKIEMHYDKEDDHKIVFESMSDSVRIASAHIADLLEEHFSGSNRFVKLVVYPDLPTTADWHGSSS